MVASAKKKKNLAIWSFFPDMVTFLCNFHLPLSYINIMKSMLSFLSVTYFNFQGYLEETVQHSVWDGERYPLSIEKSNE